MKKYTACYKVASVNVELMLYPSKQFLSIEAQIHSTGIKYKGFSIPLYKTPDTLAELIFKKSNVKIYFKGNKLVVWAAVVPTYLSLFNIQANGKENNFSKQRLMATPLSPGIVSELNDIKKDVKECRLGFIALKDDLKDLKEAMHATLDQQITNYTERSQYTRCNGVDKQHLMTQRPERFVLQKALKERNEEIESLKLQLRSMSNEQCNSKTKLHKEMNIFRSEIKTSLENIMRILTPAKKKRSTAKSTTSSMVKKIKAAYSCKTKCVLK